MDADHAAGRRPAHRRGARQQGPRRRRQVVRRRHLRSPERLLWPRPPAAHRRRHTPAPANSSTTTRWSPATIRARPWRPAWPASCPARLDEIVLLNSGSEATEAAVRIAQHYWRNIGEERNRVIAFEAGYHGSTFLAQKLVRPPVHRQRVAGALPDRPGRPAAARPRACAPAPRPTSWSTCSLVPWRTARRPRP
ncbi:aminotransferase class III-fold pyridoxal phosphate-dependent enzyme [Nocardioides convexus]|uniref:aminotransferase class III-fold pyridoxal phosphate-dependent enzyme n=1 Tax=Nocardioides convexus TaxID=2712224 RepID=UPI0024186756|nr:aminotransferase class III-fold pyridoxal phosphate-dependent enzyme [Nocardioides convexus]